METRRLLQIVEVYQPQCALTYGESPCTAALGSTGSRKCFNTLRTCQDRENFDPSDEVVLRFAASVEGLPVGQTIFQSLKSVETRPTRLNSGGQDNKRGPLGRRATVDIELSDHPYHDRLVDKYQTERKTGAAQLGGGYDPFDFGTFWRKWLVRNYYSGLRLRVLEGTFEELFEEGGDPRSREYVIDKITGPKKDGTVSIRAKDVLDLADNDKAQAPRPSQGSTDRSISQSGTTSFRVQPSSAAEDYPEEGLVRIGREILAYTRSGDSMTITGRAQRGTSAESHETGDTVQRVLSYRDERIDVIIRDLLERFAGVPEEFWDAENTAEADQWLESYRLTTDIPDPVGVTTLIGELSEFGPDIWWDEIAQKIRLRASRPPIDDEIEEIDDFSDILEDSTSIEEDPDQRISLLVVRHSQIDPTEDVGQSSNYARTFFEVSLESLENYGEEQIKTINSRWLRSQNIGAIRALASRKIRRFKEIPKLMTVRLDAKDRERVWTGDYFRVINREDVDDTGQPAERVWQVISAEEVEPGHSVQYVLQSLTAVGEGEVINRPFFIQGNDVPEYDEATPEQRDPRGGFIVGDTLQFSDGTGPYQIV